MSAENPDGSPAGDARDGQTPATCGDSPRFSSSDGGGNLITVTGCDSVATERGHTTLDSLAGAHAPPSLTVDVEPPSDNASVPSVRSIVEQPPKSSSENGFATQGLSVPLAGTNRTPWTGRQWTMSRSTGSTDTLLAHEGETAKDKTLGMVQRPIVRLTMGYKDLLESCQNRKSNKRPFPVSPQNLTTVPNHLFTNTVNPRSPAPSSTSRIQEADELPLEDRRGPNNGGFDDENDDYVIRQGEVWLDRYTIGKPLGRGSFGQVVEAYDAALRMTVAIKIIKSRPSFTNQGKIELRILKHINQVDSDDSNCIVRLLSHFFFRNHLCLVYEVLSYNLYELLRIGNFAGMNLSLVRKFGLQVLLALRFLSRNDVRVLHCDLKPENILLRDFKKARIKVIDFGSSCFVDERAYMYIQSRFYRAPEVILGARYSCEIDMWSLGCILVELYTGQPLFCGQSELDQIKAIQSLLGPLPPSLIARGHPEKLQKLDLTVHGSIPIEQQAEANLHDSIRKVLADKPGGAPGSPTAVAEDDQQVGVFVNLIAHMLRPDPQERLKPAEALQHPFFSSCAVPSMDTRARSAQSTLPTQPVRPIRGLRRDQ